MKIKSKYSIYSVIAAVILAVTGVISVVDFMYFASAQEGVQQILLAISTVIAEAYVCCKNINSLYGTLGFSLITILIYFSVAAFCSKGYRLNSAELLQFAGIYLISLSAFIICIRPSLIRTVGIILLLLPSYIISSSTIKKNEYIIVTVSFFAITVLRFFAVKKLLNIGGGQINAKSCSTGNG